MAYDNWRDPNTKAFNNCWTIDEYGSQNQVLFIAEAYHLGLISKEEFYGIAINYSPTPGVFIRYPDHIDDWSAQDDLMGAASVSKAIASEIYWYGNKYNWKWKNRILWRYPVFKSMIKAAAGLKLNLWDNTKLALAFLWNLTEKKEETSGKLLLWLTTKVLNSPWYVRVWEKRMQSMYGVEWLSVVMSIYFSAKGPNGKEHPFIKAALGH